MDSILPAGSAAPPGGDAKPLRALREAAEAVENAPVKRALTILIAAAGDDVDRARGNLERWYDSAVDREDGVSVLQKRLSTCPEC